MKKRIGASELQIGMYVNLGTWTGHNFLRSNFRIKSENQIRAIIDSGIGEVEIDLSRSDVAPTDPLLDDISHISHSDTPAKTEPPAPLPDWNQNNLVPAGLLAAIEDRRMPPDQKSEAVYRHSVELMEHLLETPSAENIQTSKKVIGAITDLILSDDQTANNLLRITSHDFYTYTHSVNVGVTSIMLAKELFRDSDAHDLHELGAGFFLHDLGKVNVDAAIINKPGRLTEEEMCRMRIHPYQGYKLLKEANALSEECRYIVLQHHEMSDGSGYPKRLKEDEIHLYAKICCIADVFDALTAERSYKRAMTPFEALQLMKDEMLQHFQKELFDSFVKLFKQL
jgi:HD-GYP domain-containing protein (c-di-GMP phosphodiesterase class II)